MPQIPCIETEKKILIQKFSEDFDREVSDFLRFYERNKEDVRFFCENWDVLKSVFLNSVDTTVNAGYDMPTEPTESLSFILWFLGHEVLDDGEPYFLWVRRDMGDFNLKSMEKLNNPKKVSCSPEDRGAFPVIFSHYSLVPAHLQDKVKPIDCIDVLKGLVEGVLNTRAKFPARNYAPSPTQSFLQKLLTEI